MTRHSKNATAGPLYTYHEQRKDSKRAGYGTQTVRLGRDSFKDFDCCSLTLQPCRDPVITPDGHLFEREAILENILHQKKEIERKMKEYNRQMQEIASEEQKKIASAAAEVRRQFLQLESLSQTLMPSETAPKPSTSSVLSSDETSSSALDALNAVYATPSLVEPPSVRSIYVAATDSKAPPKPAGSKPAISNMTGEAAHKMPSFWLPSQTPQASNKVDSRLVKKPDNKVRCPMTKKPLKVKDLITVKLKPLNEGTSRTGLISQSARYVCWITNDVLSNGIASAVLRPSGAVVTMESVEKIVKKDMIDPISGQRLTDDDIIPLARGATGFAAEGLNHLASKTNVVMPFG